MSLTLAVVMVGVAVALAAGIPKIEDLPLLRTGVQTHQFCSYDRAGDNYDWCYFPLYREANGECVLFDAYGPGCVFRHHMNLWRGAYEGINIRYYFDDETKPRIDMDVSTFFSEKNPLGIFHAPVAMVGGDDFRVMYCPMFFRKRLKIALSAEPGGFRDDSTPWTGRYDKIPEPRYHWYNFTYHTYAEDPGQESWKPGDKETALGKLWQDAETGRDPKPRVGPSEGFCPRLTPGKRIALKDVQGVGSVTSLGMEVDPFTEEALFNTWLTITFDAARTPQVEAPLGVFFGAYQGKTESSFSSLLLTYLPHWMNCYFPMPYWKSLKIEFENRGKSDVTLHTLVGYASSDDRHYSKKDSGYFHAVYYREFPRTEGHDYTYLQFVGHGHVVGHVTARYDTSMEENERTYFDGSLTPQIIGEGFEDDHGMGWGLKNLQHAVFGAHAADGGAGVAYRFFYPDLYEFETGIKHGHQTYGPHSPLGHEGMYVAGNEESVTFFYARETPALKLTDELDVGNAASEKAHGYRVTGERKDVKGKWWYDGEYNNVLFATPPTADDGVMLSPSKHDPATVTLRQAQGDGLSCFSQFTVRIDPKNKGIRLRRRTDKAVNRQLARVYVDGKLVTERPWYSVDYEKTFRDIRWFDTDFDIPAKWTKGKSKVTIRIDPVGDRPWLEFRYWVYSRTR